jgi:hypothetical protein
VSPVTEVDSGAAAAMRFRWVLAGVMLGLAGALMDVVPGRGYGGGSTQGVPGDRFVSIIRVASTIDVKTRTNNPTDITVGSDPFRMVFTPWP